MARRVQQQGAVVRKLILVTAILLAGCATHTHIGDCPSCSGFVIVQDKVSDEIQTRQIYEAVQKAFQQVAKPAATPAPVTSTTGGSK